MSHEQKISLDQISTALAPHLEAMNARIAASKNHVARVRAILDGTATEPTPGMLYPCYILQLSKNTKDEPRITLSLVEVAAFMENGELKTRTNTMPDFTPIIITQTSFGINVIKGTESALRPIYFSGYFSNVLVGRVVNAVKEIAKSAPDRPFIYGIEQVTQNSLVIPEASKGKLSLVVIDAATEVARADIPAHTPAPNNLPANDLERAVFENIEAHMVSPRYRVSHQPLDRKTHILGASETEIFRMALSDGLVLELKRKLGTMNRQGRKDVLEATLSLIDTDSDEPKHLAKKQPLSGSIVFSNSDALYRLKSLSLHLGWHEIIADAYDLNSGP